MEIFKHDCDVLEIRFVGKGLEQLKELARHFEFTETHEVISKGIALLQNLKNKS